MALRVKREGWQGDEYVTVLEYIPDPTCFNAEGVEHFGTNCLNCGCDSCNRLRGAKPEGKIFFNTTTSGE